MRTYNRGILTILLACGAVACGARGSGVAAQETRSVPVFKELNADHVSRVVLTVRQGTSGPIELTVSGDDNLVPEVETVVEGDILVVRARDGQALDPVVPLSITATIPELRKSHSSGSVDVKVEGLSNTEFTVVARDTSDVELLGTTSTLTIQSSGSADVRARELEAMDVTIDSSDSSDVDVCARGRLVVKATGSADVSYFCSPTRVETDVRDAADVYPGG